MCINTVNRFNKGMLSYIMLFVTAVFMIVGFYSVVYGQSPFDKIAFGKKISKVNQWRFLRGNNKAARKWNHLGFVWVKRQTEFAKPFRQAF